MSLYSVQKLLYRLNKDAATRERYATERAALLAECALTEEERRAFTDGDVGRLYMMGAHPLLLAPFAGRSGLKWPDYLATLKRARDMEALKTQATADERR
jgi:hypothetical protein